MDSQQQQNRQTGVDECPICLTALAVGRALFTTSCGHQFHFDCISKLNDFSQKSCPICRNPVPQLNAIGAAPSVPPTQVNTQPTTSTTSTTTSTAPVQSNTNRVQFAQVYKPTGLFNMADYPEDFVDELAVARLLEKEKIQTENILERTLNLSAILEKEQLSATAPANMLGMLSLEAPPVLEDESKSRAPLDLMVVVDTSGSMKGEKIALVKETLGFLLTQLTPLDRFSLVGFENHACIYSNFQKVNEERQKLLIRKLQAQGGTSIASGFKAALDVLYSRTTKNPITSILFLTDGEDSSALGALPGIAPLIPEGCSVHSFGYGKDHDAKVLVKIAELTSGTFTYIEDNTTIAPAFGNCLGGLLTVVALGIQIEIRLSQNVYVDTLLSHYKSIDKHPDYVISLPDLFAEEKRDIIISFSIPTSAVTDKHVIATAVVRYKDSLQVDNIISTKPVEFSIARPEVAQLNGVSNPKLVLQRKRIVVADALTQALDYAEQNKFTSVKSIIEDAARFVLEKETLPSRWDTATDDPLLKDLLNDLSSCLLRLGTREQSSKGGYAYAQSKTWMHKQQRAQTSEETHYKTAVQKKVQLKFSKKN